MQTSRGIFCFVFWSSTCWCLQVDVKFTLELEMPFRLLYSQILWTTFPKLSTLNSFNYNNIFFVVPVDACFKRGLKLRDACDVAGGAEKYFLKWWQTADLKTHVSLEVLCNLVQVNFCIFQCDVSHVSPLEQNIETAAMCERKKRPFLSFL